MSEQKNLSGPDGLKKINDLVKDIRIAMMTTAAPDGSFDSRPMVTQKSDFDGDVWFLTRAESGKVAEIQDDSHISLLYADADNSKFVSAKGRAYLSRDRAKIQELWNPMYKAWFPEGEDDPSITVLRVNISEAQYWEASSSKLLRGLKYVAAAATGGAIDLGKTGKITLG